MLSIFPVWKAGAHVPTHWVMPHRGPPAWHWGAVQNPRAFSDLNRLPPEQVLLTGFQQAAHGRSLPPHRVTVPSGVN